MTEVKKEIDVKSYDSFDSGNAVAKSLVTSIETGIDTMNTAKTKLTDSSIFMGPICDSCVTGFEKAFGKADLLKGNFNTIGDYLLKASSDYQSSDEKAKNVLNIDSDGKITVGSYKQSSTGNATQDQIYNFLASKGFNNAAISGILANIEHESGFRTDALGDGGTSYGLCQWHNGRWTNLKNYCKENNYDASSVEGQMNYLVHELKTGYSGVYDTLMSVPNTDKGAYDAAYKWTTDFEIPADTQNQANNRGNTAVSSYWPTYST